MIPIGTYIAATQLPPNNPGYLSAINKPLMIVDTSGTIATATTLSFSGNQQLWLYAFDFSKHPMVANAGYYVTGVSYTTLTGGDGKMVVNTSSQYNNMIGVTVSGGTINTSYNLVVAATLNNSEIISCSLTIKTIQ